MPSSNNKRPLAICVRCFVPTRCHLLAMPCSLGLAGGGGALEGAGRGTWLSTRLRSQPRLPQDRSAQSPAVHYQLLVPCQDEPKRRVWQEARGSASAMVGSPALACMLLRCLAVAVSRYAHAHA